MVEDRLADSVRQLLLNRDPYDRHVLNNVGVILMLAHDIVFQYIFT